MSRWDPSDLPGLPGRSSQVAGLRVPTEIAAAILDGNWRDSELLRTAEAILRVVDRDRARRARKETA